MPLSAACLFLLNITLSICYCSSLAWADVVLHCLVQLHQWPPDTVECRFRSQSQITHQTEKHSLDLDTWCSKALEGHALFREQKTSFVIQKFTFTYKIWFLRTDTSFFRPTVHFSLKNFIFSCAHFFPSESSLLCIHFFFLSTIISFFATTSFFRARLRSFVHTAPSSLPFRLLWHNNEYVSNY